MDQRIFCLHMIYRKRIERQSCTLDDNLVVHLNNPVNMNKLDALGQHDNRYINHTVTDDTVQFLVLANTLLNRIHGKISELHFTIGRAKLIDWPTMSYLCLEADDNRK